MNMASRNRKGPLDVLRSMLIRLLDTAGTVPITGPSGTVLLPWEDSRVSIPAEAEPFLVSPKS